MSQHKQYCKKCKDKGFSLCATNRELHSELQTLKDLFNKNIKYFRTPNPQTLVEESSNNGSSNHTQRANSTSSTKNAQTKDTRAGSTTSDPPREPRSEQEATQQAQHSGFCSNWHSPLTKEKQSHIITTIYRKLSMLLHPDKTKDKTKQDWFVSCTRDREEGKFYKLASLAIKLNALESFSCLECQLLELDYQFLTRQLYIYRNSAPVLYEKCIKREDKQRLVSMMSSL